MGLRQAVSNDSSQPLNVVVTGATGGIGRYLTHRLLLQGHQVWGLARSSMADVKEERFHSSICNVAIWEEVERVANWGKQDPGWGEIHALVHCAAEQGPIGPTATADPIAWAAAVRTNLEGTFNVIRAFHELLHGSEGGHAKVLCFAGGGATKPRPNFGAYAASKTAVVRLVENLAGEWAGRQIDINAIAPGALPTRMTEQVLAVDAAKAGAAEVLAARETLARGEKGFERMGSLVDFLLSAKSNGITGKLISAPWDPWEKFAEQRERLQASNLLTLRRITPEDRGEAW